MGDKDNYYVHETAVIDDGAVIGRDTKVWHFSHVMPGVVIGESCVLGQNVFVASNVVIGDNVHIQNNVSVYEGVTLEDDVFCGPSMVFTNVKYPRSGFPVSGPDEYAETLVRRGATLGANSTVVCGVEIGEHALVGAGAVITKDVPPHAVVTGVPARQVGFICECGELFGDVEPDGEEVCGVCGKRYKRSGGGLVGKE
ncbi:MAG: N-acetyltransferase [Candidatus Coatesbacteria bacterium]|nr:MAG: N-acetyltransferase [Candidatus Coatesbacteria bacterium]